MRVCLLGPALAVSVALLISCGKRGQPSRNEKTDSAPRAVYVAPAVKRAMPRVINVTGTLEAHERSTLSTKVAGRVEEMNVDIGSPVAAGDVLARIDPRDYELRAQQAEAALAQARTLLGLPAEGDDDQVEMPKVTSVRLAKAVLEEATKNRDRVQNLSAVGIASASELDTVEAAYTVALARYETAMEEARTRMAALAGRRAEYDLARKQMSDTAIRAPYSGAVQSRTANLGEYLSAGTPVLQVVKTDPLRLKLDVPERYSHFVRSNQLVQLTVEGETNLYSGRIARISPALEESTRMLLVEADVPAQASLRPGVFARAEVIVNESDPGLSVPPSAIVTFAGIEKVVSIEGNKAVERPVTTGRRGSDWVEVVSGLNEGERVVLNPAGLKTGQLLVVASAREEEPKSARAAQEDSLVPVP